MSKNIIIPAKDTKIIKFNQYQKSYKYAKIILKIHSQKK